MPDYEREKLELERERLVLEKERLRGSHEHQQETLKLQRSHLWLQQRFLHKNFSAILAAAISAGAVLLSAVQYYEGQAAEERQFAFVQATAERDFALRWVDLVLQHQDEILLPETSSGAVRTNIVECRERTFDTFVDAG